jgi:serine protease inhibitor ecotin
LEEEKGSQVRKAPPDVEAFKAKLLAGKTLEKECNVIRQTTLKIDRIWK